MSKLKMIGSGDKINTPSIKKMMMEDLVSELDANLDEQFKNDFNDKTSYPCKRCNASGIDSEEKMPCLACEGTGMDYEIHYGVKDGAMFAYTVQYGLDFFKEMCKAWREAEAEMTLRERTERMSVVRYKLPAVIDMELQARGFSPQDIRGSGEKRDEVVKIIQRDYPDLMCTNYRF